MTTTLDLSRGERTRLSILETAAEIASVEGLEGLTIGRLATELGMSKSGLFAHFGSKEELQLATVAHAREVFIEKIIRPALREKRGLPRLRALCNRWIDYSEAKFFRGGCFFLAAATEFDSRPGPVRDAIARAWSEWLTALETAVRLAQENGELSPELEARQLAFEINAVEMAANTDSQLIGDEKAYDRARTAIATRLESLAQPH